MSTSVTAPLRIVVVDNDPSALELVVLDLGLEGHDVVGQGRTGADAQRLTRELVPDVLVVDHRMPPGLTGAEVAASVARDQPTVRVIVYTNYQDHAIVDAVERSGASYVPKGNLRTLRDAVVGER
ncbi:response regulator [Actinospongicola halichondriae]|uniref:response regulator n=1 Tax=Actinospongicola halichondriae TaxID=3236844 RepID=UPI003D599954